jgi:hypothetical protein
LVPLPLILSHHKLAMSLKHVIILRLCWYFVLQVACCHSVTPHQESLELLILQESITAGTFREIFDCMITHDQLVLVKDGVSLLHVKNVLRYPCCLLQIILLTED